MLELIGKNIQKLLIKLTLLLIYDTRRMEMYPVSNISEKNYSDLE